MARIGGPHLAHVKQGFAIFSPDSKRFVIVVSKPNLARNTNEYSLLLFSTARVFNGAGPTVLASFSSASVVDGVSDLHWSEDNDTIFFLGALGARPKQLYAVRRSTRRLQQLTKHPTSLLSYAVSERTGAIVFTAEGTEVDLEGDHLGFRVSTESLPDLIRGKIDTHQAALFATHRGGRRPVQLHTQGRLDPSAKDLYLSPDGRHLVVKTDVMTVPERWRQYDDPIYQRLLQHPLPEGMPSRILRYEAVDTGTGKSVVLLNSPASYSQADVLWSPDSNSVLLCGVYLPLDVAEEGELRARRFQRFVIEIELRTGMVRKLTTEDLTPVHWNRRTKIVEFKKSKQGTNVSHESQAVYYRRRGLTWEQLTISSDVSQEAILEVRTDEDLNLPPRIVAVNPKTGQKKTILKLNPQLACLTLGKVEAVRWFDPGGRPVDGGLYFPPDYAPGTRYPLVIQTHGFDPHGFWMNGPYTTGFAAQPLANKGFIVLQMDDIFYDSLVTPEEGQRVMGAYESAIEYLDARGLIDPQRIGILGFSRTCYYVKYALTHSKRHFAAAIAIDGLDGGYVQNLAFYNTAPNLSYEFDTVTGAPPFGSGLFVWLKNAPGFLLDRVHTPMLSLALGPDSLLGEWEWFAGLKRLDKPVDLLYLPSGTHLLVRPRDCLTAAQATVDWFDFWINGKEDSIPENARWYSRWRQLRSGAERGTGRGLSPPQ
jgi:dipeptidyl aminopeptidase/acylaminoacyl peptidase